MRVRRPQADRTSGVTLTQSRLARLRFVTILGLLSAFGPFSIDLYLPALPELTRDLGASASLGQLTLTASIAGLALGQLVAGPLSDRFGRRPPLLAGVAAYVLLSLACAAAPTIWALIGLRFLQGLAGSAGIVIARAIVRDVHEGVEAARLYSVLIVVTGAAPIVAPIVGGQLLLVTDWRGLFVALAAVTAVVLAAAAFGLRETLPHARREDKGLREIGATFALVSRDRAFVSYSLTLGFAFAEMFAYIAASPFVLEDIHGVSPQAFSLVFATNAVGLMASSQVNRALVGRVGLRRLLGAGVAAGTAAGLCLLVVVLLDAGLPAILPCLFVAVASLGVVIPNATALALTPFPNVAGSASALIGATQFAFGAVAAPLVGAFGRDTAVPMAVAMATFGMLAAVVFLSSRRPAADARAA
jgi:DHA1 family bicyclomycin/chloramphenicol resistance-like MFS transporter